MQLNLTGQSRFITKIATSTTSSALVRFKVQIVDADTGAIALCADHSIPEAVTFDWDIEFAPAWGLYEVILSTENLEAEQGGTSMRQTAHFVDPRLL
jgi:hypothetical protein